MLLIGVFLLPVYMMSRDPSPKGLPSATGRVAPPVAAEKRSVAASSGTESRQDAGRLPALTTARSASDPRVEVRVTAIERRRGVVRVALVFSNAGPEPIRVTLDNSRILLASSADRRYPVVADSAGTKIPGTFSGVVLPERPLMHWLEFRVPDTVLGGVELTLEGSRTERDSLSLAPLSFTLPVP